MMSMSENQATQVLWGTDINTADIQTRLRNFLIDFNLGADEDNDMAGTYYVQLLREIDDTEIYVLTVDCNHIKAHDP